MCPWFLLYLLDLQENWTDVQQLANVEETELTARPDEDKPHIVQDREETDSKMQSKHNSSANLREGTIF